MKYLIEQLHDHNYVYLKRESVAVAELGASKIYAKTIYVCVDCGVGLDWYDLDEPTVVGEDK